MCRGTNTSLIKCSWFWLSAATVFRMSLLLTVFEARAFIAA